MKMWQLAAPAATVTVEQDVPMSPVFVCDVHGQRLRYDSDWIVAIGIVCEKCVAVSGFARYNDISLMFSCWSSLMYSSR